MATINQFLKRKTLPLYPVVVITGRSVSLVQYATDILLRRLPENSEVQRFSYPFSPEALLTILSQPSIFHVYHVVIYNVESPQADLSPLEWYTNNPTPAMTLVITSVITSSNQRREGHSLKQKLEDKRHLISATGKVYYIDCTNLNDESLHLFVSLAGVPEPDVEWLIETSAGDLEAIVNAVTLLEVFPTVADGLVRRIAPAVASSHTFYKYMILDTGDDLALLNQLSKRFSQLAVMATIKGFISLNDLLALAKQVELEPFQVKRLLPLAQNTKPEYWLGKLDQITGLMEYARAGCPGIRNYLHSFA